MAYVEFKKNGMYAADSRDVYYRTSCSALAASDYQYITNISLKVEV